jgi:hypothetical protein
MKRLLIVNVLLLAVVVGLVVQIVALWWSAEAAVDATAPREVKTQRLEIPSAARKPPPPDLAKHIAEKDLFDQSRSSAPVTVAGPAAAPVPLTLVLLGITVAGGGREALLKDQAQPKPLWLREGEEYNGYKLRRIDAASVVMASPTGDEVTLMINVEKGKGVAVPATGPAGIQPPSPAPAVARATPHAPRPGASPAPDIKEKIERLREEARRRRQNKAQQQQQQAQ